MERKYIRFSVPGWKDRFKLVGELDNGKGKEIGDTVLRNEVQGWLGPGSRSH